MYILSVLSRNKEFFKHEFMHSGMCPSWPCGGKAKPTKEVIRKQLIKQVSGLVWRKRIAELSILPPPFANQPPKSPTFLTRILANDLITHYIVYFILFNNVVLMFTCLIMVVTENAQTSFAHGLAL